MVEAVSPGGLHSVKQCLGPHLAHPFVPPPSVSHIASRCARCLPAVVVRPGRADHNGTILAMPSPLALPQVVGLADHSMCSSVTIKLKSSETIALSESSSGAVTLGNKTHPRR